jgi:hypothetical protein
MSLDTEVVPAADGTLRQGDLLEAAASPLALSLQDFVCRIRRRAAGLAQPRQPSRLHRPGPAASPARAGQSQAQAVRAQAEVVHAVTELLADRGERAAIVNGEMGCGKTTVGIATAAVLHAEGYRRTLVLSPPHLVYKWRREIQETVAGAKVWVLNGPDTLVKLIKLREQLGVPAARPGVLRARARADAHGFPLEARLQRAAHAARRRGRMPGLRPGHHQPRRRADQPGRARSRGLPPQVQPLRRTAVDADPTAEPVRQRPVHGRLQSLAAHPDHRGSHRAEADAEVRRRLPGLDARATTSTSSSTSWMPTASWSSRTARRTAWSARWRTWSSASARAATSRPSSSSATCRKARSTCSSPTRRTSTRTAAPHRARPWACSRRRRARPCCSPAR